MDQPVNFSGVMPSAEAHFFDTAQMHVNNPTAKGSGINVPFPSPASGSDYWAESGLLKTYAPEERINYAGEGIFHYNNLSSLFHTTGTRPVQSDFNIFNPFIHHNARTTITGQETGPFIIPYVSDYTITTPFYPYPF